MSRTPQALANAIEEINPRLDERDVEAREERQPTYTPTPFLMPGMVAAVNDRKAGPLTPIRPAERAVTPPPPQKPTLQAVGQIVNADPEASRPPVAWNGRTIGPRELDTKLAEQIARVRAYRADAAAMQREDMRTEIGQIEHLVVTLGAIGAISEERAKFLLSELRGEHGSVVVNVPAPVVNVANHIDARPPQGDLEVEHTKTGGLRLTRTPA